MKEKNKNRLRPSSPLPPPPPPKSLKTTTSFRLSLSLSLLRREQTDGCAHFRRRHRNLTSRDYYDRLTGTDISSSSSPATNHHHYIHSPFVSLPNKIHRPSVHHHHSTSSRLHAYSAHFPYPQLKILNSTRVVWRRRRRRLQRQLRLI